MDERIIITIGLGLLGLILGSFAGASVWRLRARQLRQDVKNGEKIDAADKHEIAKLQKKSVKSDRSVCLHCGHELKWYDLIPLASWVSLKGKCRYCHKKIGWFEPAIELGLAAFFVLSFLFWPVAFVTPLDTLQFVIWLLAGLGLTILFVYDAKWFLLPNVITFPLIGLGALNALLFIASNEFESSVIVNVFLSCLVLSGFYLAIYILSKRQWVGFGDVKLGLVLALLLADWRLAIVAFFLANLIGTIIFLPSMVIGKIKRQTHIPFGPLLIAGWAIAGLFGARILDWYMSLTLGV